MQREVRGIVSFPSSTEKYESLDRGLVRNRIRPRVVRRCVLVLSLALAAGFNLNSSSEDRERGDVRDLLADIRIDGSVGGFELAPQLEIGRIMPGELLGGGSGQSLAMGNWTRSGASPAAFEVETRFVRSMPGVWRMRVRDFDSTHTTTARYTLTSPDGTANGLASVEDPSSVIQVRISPLPPSVVDSDLDYLTIEGGVMLDLDLLGVRTSGVHVGTLTVTLENY